MWGWLPVATGVTEEDAAARRRMCSLGEANVFSFRRNVFTLAGDVFSFRRCAPVGGRARKEG